MSNEKRAGFIVRQKVSSGCRRSKSQMLKKQAKSIPRFVSDSACFVSFFLLFRPCRR